ncbi:uncharacterized protein LOC113146962 [Cyclospora cayetanensis]|uniref:Uncharacterized protein LOC113146962 n=1 Tax=Cyclospora cayetanensis TaxID=88456 RepID=A0A6P6RUW9_9EIME|nr:uncharacterized protein LOC113146962 [Cyclospora cayetanensis]
MEGPVSRLVPSLLLACGSGPEGFCSFSDGHVCEVTGGYLRSTSFNGTTQYIPLYTDSCKMGHAAHNIDGCGYVLCASCDEAKLVALGGSGVEGDIQMVQLSCTPPKSMWKKKLSASCSMEILCLDFSPCGNRLFCLSSGKQKVTQQELHRFVVQYVTVLSASDGAVQICHQLQWDDVSSYPRKLLAATGELYAVLSDTNVMMFQLLKSSEEAFTTSGLLLPVAAAAASGQPECPARNMTICGSCWVTAKGSHGGNASTFLLLAVSTKKLLAIGVGWLGAEGPFLAWVTSTEQKYLSLAAVDSRGMVLGLTDNSVIHIFQLNERAAASLMQKSEADRQQHNLEGLHEYQRKAIASCLLELQRSCHTGINAPPLKFPSQENEFTPAPTSEDPETLLLLRDEIHFQIPTSGYIPERFSPNKYGIDPPLSNYIAIVSVLLVPSTSYACV